MEAGFERADSENLPVVDTTMVNDYFVNNAKYVSGEIKNIKAQRAGREQYGDDAIAFVQIRRSTESSVCIVKAKVTPEHKIHKTGYSVSLMIDEKEEKVLKCECHDCTASTGGCKHAIAFLLWLHRRSEEPSVTSVTCYWRSSKLIHAFNELKTNTKKHAREIREQQHATGGGPSTIKNLSEIEEKLLNIMTPIIIDGVESIPELGIEEVVADTNTENIETELEFITPNENNAELEIHLEEELWLALAEKHLQSRGVNWVQTEKLCFNEWSNPDDNELGVQIVKDLHRTGCSLFCGAAGQENQALLKRVLLAYARWNKSVGYCQGFNMLAALILQVMDKSETDSVKVMIYLIEGVLPESYFANNLRGLSVDMVVFRDLLKIRLPQLSKHLEALQNDAREGNSYEPPLTNVFTMQWFLTLFCNCLPQSTVLRVWDLIFLEGNEILLRTAIAIWEKLSDRILAVNSADEFYSIMGVLTREMLEFGLVDSNTLIKSIVSIGACVELNEMRDRYLYNITPWTQSVQSAAKKGFKLFYSDDDDIESDIDEKATVTAVYGMSLRRRKEKHSAASGSNIIQPYAHGHPDRERLALDISALKKQYAKLRERQRQAHIILQAACARQPIGQSPNPSPIAMNHLLLGKNAIVNSRGRRLGPPKGAIPPARTKEPMKKDPQGATLQWKDTAKVRYPRRQSVPEAALETNTTVNVNYQADSDSSSYSEDDASSTSTELCDEPDRMNDFDTDVIIQSKTNEVIKNSLNNEKTLITSTETNDNVGTFNSSEIKNVSSDDVVELSNDDVCNKSVSESLKTVSKTVSMDIKNEPVIVDDFDSFQKYDDANVTTENKEKFSKEDLTVEYSDYLMDFDDSVNKKIKRNLEDNLNVLEATFDRVTEDLPFEISSKAIDAKKEVKSKTETLEANEENLIFEIIKDETESKLDIRNNEIIDISKLISPEKSENLTSETSTDQLNLNIKSDDLNYNQFSEKNAAPLKMLDSATNLQFSNNIKEVFSLNLLTDEIDTQLSIASNNTNKEETNEVNVNFEFETFLQERVKILKENSSDSLSSPKEEIITWKSSEDKLRRYKSYEETPQKYTNKSPLQKQKSFDVSNLPSIDITFWKPYEIKEDIQQEIFEAENKKTEKIENIQRSKFPICKQKSVDISKFSSSESSPSKSPDIEKDIQEESLSDLDVREISRSSSNFRLLFEDKLTKSEIKDSKKEDTKDVLRQPSLDLLQVEDKRYEAGRRNSERALKIIQENSLILHRILQHQSSKSTDKDDSEDELCRSPISKSFKTESSVSKEDKADEERSSKDGDETFESGAESLSVSPALIEDELLTKRSETEETLKEQIESSDKQKENQFTISKNFENEDYIFSSYQKSENISFSNDNFTDLQFPTEKNSDLKTAEYSSITNKENSLKDLLDNENDCNTVLTANTDFEKYFPASDDTNIKHERHKSPKFTKYNNENEDKQYVLHEYAFKNTDSSKEKINTNLKDDTADQVENIHDKEEEPKFTISSNNLSKSTQDILQKYRDSSILRLEEKNCKLEINYKSDTPENVSKSSKYKDEFFVKENLQTGIAYKPETVENVLKTQIYSEKLSELNYKKHEDSFLNLGDIQNKTSYKSDIFEDIPKSLKCSEKSPELTKYNYKKYQDSVFNEENIQTDSCHKSATLENVLKSPKYSEKSPELYKKYENNFFNPEDSQKDINYDTLESKSPKFAEKLSELNYKKYENSFQNEVKQNESNASSYHQQENIFSNNFEKSPEKRKDYLKTSSEVNLETNYGKKYEDFSTDTDKFNSSRPSEKEPYKYSSVYIQKDNEEKSSINLHKSPEQKFDTDYDYKYIKYKTSSPEEDNFTSKYLRTDTETKSSNSSNYLYKSPEKTKPDSLHESDYTLDYLSPKNKKHSDFDSESKTLNESSKFEASSISNDDIIDNNVYSSKKIDSNIMPTSYPQISSDSSYNRSHLSIDLKSSPRDCSPEISPPKHLSCLQFTSFQTDIPCTSKSIQFTPICSKNKNDVSPTTTSPSKGNPKYFSSFNLPTLSPPRRSVKSPLSPDKCFNPFPVQPTTRQPKEIGVRLGLYKDLSPLKSPTK